MSGRTDPGDYRIAEAGRAARQGLGGCLTLMGLGLFGVAALICALMAGVKASYGDATWWQPGASAFVLAVITLAIWKNMDRAVDSSGGGLAAAREAEQASGRITGAGRAASELQLWLAGVSMAVVWLFAIFSWNAGWASGTTARVVLVVIVVAITTFAANALRQARVARRAGSSVLYLDTVPVRIGGKLNGRVQIGLGADPGDVSLKLVCQRVSERRNPSAIHNYGSHRHTTDALKDIDVVREDEQRIPVASLSREGAERWSVPVSFELPADAEPTDESNPKEKLQWVLRLSSRDAGGKTHTDAWEVWVQGAGGE